MRSPIAALVAGCLSVGAGGCTSSDGAIFAPRATTTGDGSEGEVGSTGPGWGCDAHVGVRVQGNDPRFTPGCGESCDSDWCWCETCSVLTGPLARMSSGPHQIRVQAGVSGTAEYTLKLAADSGAVLLEQTFSRTGLFEDVFDFSVTDDCPVVDVEWIQQTDDVCSRIYEVVVDP